jgi:bifunctional DNA primase/polymerase-like protein
MMGDIDWFGTIFGAVPEGDISWNARVAKAMIRTGLAPVLIRPGDKRAACTLSAKDEKTADTRAQDEARARGNPRWDKVRHECGHKHALTEEKHLNRKRVKELLEAGANLAVSFEHNTRRVMVVDVDTDAERAAFLDACAIGDQDVPLTVTSPGVFDKAGEVWKHKNGGHIWFDVADDAELPGTKGKATWCACHLFSMPGCAKSWTVFWGTGYVLVPPSVRPEGAYRVTGEVLQAPAWLLEIARESVNVTPAGNGAGELNVDDGDPINAWSASTSWATLLTEDGWSEWGVDSCGCTTWTLPGGASNPKSATAHEVGCGRVPTDGGHGPMHIWSDALRPGGKDTLSKLSYVAHMRHGGDMSAAMSILGIQRSRQEDLFDSLDVLGKAPAPASSGALPDDVEADEEDERPDTWARVDLTTYLDGTWVPEQPTMLTREDGIGLLYDGRVHSVYGESESGKSLILMAEAVRLMQDGHDVLWVTLDSDAGEDVSRALSFGCPPEVIAKHLDYRQPDGPAISSPSFAEMFTGSYKLAVIDGVTVAIQLLGQSGNKGDPNDAIVRFFKIFPRRLAKRTGAAVVLIDHVSKDSDARGRFAIGGQAKMSEVDGANYIVEPVAPPVKGGIGKISLRVAKDRPAGVRRHCGAWRAKDRTQEAAVIEVDSREEITRFRIHPPDTVITQIDPFEIPESRAPERPELAMTAISDLLSGQEKGLSKKAIEEAMRGIAGKNKVALALEIMTNEGYVESRVGDRNAHLHVLVHTYSGPVTEDEGEGIAPVHPLRAGRSGS